MHQCQAQPHPTRWPPSPGYGNSRADTGLGDGERSGNGRGNDEPSDIGRVNGEHPGS